MPLIRAGPGTRASKVTDPMSAAGECSTGHGWNRFYVAAAALGEARFRECS